MTSLQTKIPEIVIAPASGFCAGVSSAINCVTKLLEQNPDHRVIIDGELVHNRLVCDELYHKGAYLLSDKTRDHEIAITDVTPDDIVVIRAHGAPLQRRHQLKCIGCKIIDATCPLVQKITDIVISQQDRNIILLGEKDHAEAIGLKSYAPWVCICENLDEVASLYSYIKNNKTTWAKTETLLIDERRTWSFRPNKSWVLVCQSTLNVSFLQATKEFFAKENFSIEVFDTICVATKLRQKGIEAIAKCDAVIVIGGKNSANTKRLFQNASQKVKYVWWMEDVSELAGVQWEQFSIIGLTAGASTPPKQILAFRDAILKK